MKEFFKMLLAAVCGSVIAGIVTLVFFITFIGNLFTVETGPAVPPGSVLKVDMSEFAIAEQPQTADLQAYLQGNVVESVTLWNAVQAIRSASKDPRICMIYLKPDGAGAGIAQIEELRQALAEFRQSGKPVISFSEFPTTGAYWLATAADKIYLSSNKGAGPQINGIGTQMIFLGDLLNKLDINAQLIRHGKYKSAGEMFTKSSPSEENMLQNRQMILSMWKTVSEEISVTRGIDAGKFETLVNDLKLNTCQDMVDNGLADELMTREELKEKLATLAMKEKFSDVSIVGFADYIKVTARGCNAARPQVAILFAEGEIVEGTSDTDIDGDRYASVIAGLRRDENVKAVVFRVSSPGGSVLASDKILTEIELLRKEKPVIASYGDYAASGGYWISNSCDKIYTDKTTLTGSIGVFSLVPDVSKTLRNHLHVNMVTVSSTKHNGGIFAPLDNQEKEAMQKQVDDIYTSFVAKVATGRGLEPEYVNEIAQGRVWTGQDAIGLGLADESGTLMDAVRYAYSLVGDADPSTWNIGVYPQVEPDILGELLSQVGSQGGSLDGIKAIESITGVESLLLRWGRAVSKEKFFARLPYDIKIK